MTTPARHMQDASARWLLPLVVGSYLLWGCAFNLAIPLGEGPDEPAHFFYIQHLARQLSFPVLQPRFEDNDTAEAYQPPLYYFIGALLTWPLLDRDPVLRYTPTPPASGRHPQFQHPPFSTAVQGGSLAWRLLRAYSLFLGLMTLSAIYQAARRLFSGPWLPLAALSYVALNPQFIYIHSLVTNDAMATAVGSLLLLFIVCNTPDEASLRWGQAGLLLGLAALSKTHVPLLGAGLAPAALALAGRVLRTPAAHWRSLAALMGVPTIMAGWWIVRNRFLYGDWTGISLSMKVVPQNHHDPALTLSQFAEIFPHLAEQSLRSWWLKLGWSGFDLPKRLFNAIAFIHIGIWAAALVGFAVSQFRRLRVDPAAFRLGLSAAALLGGYFYYNTISNQTGWQARLIFPGCLIASLVFVEGCRRLFPGKDRWVAVCLILLQSSLLAYVFLTIVLPVYLVF